jgi:hypothetical protein
VSLRTVYCTAASVPKSTDVAPVNPVPVMVTEEPWGPELGVIEITRGT